MFENVATGLYSSMLGRYDRRQVFVDISQGSRQPRSQYRRTWGVHADGLAVNWAWIREAARGVSRTLRPGLLASSVPGGGVLVTGPGEEGPWPEGFIATDERGRVQVSTGAPETIVARVEEALVKQRLAVIALPKDGSASDVPRALLRRRSPRTLVVVVHVPPTPDLGLPSNPATDRFYRLPAIGVAGARPDGSVTSASTRRDGVVSAIDIAPTILGHLRLPVPRAMRGDVIERTDQVPPDRLAALRARWAHTRSGAQSSSFHGVVLVAVALGLALAAVRGWRNGLRIGGLMLMWWPAVVLLIGTHAVARPGIERFWVPTIALAAAVLTDRVLGWPRGALAPAAVGVVAFSVDLLRGGDLLSVSLLGPSLISGSRFYGVSNELAPLLPIMAFVALAATGSRWPAYIFVGAALVFVVGVGRLGADVGGALSIAGAFVVATYVARRARLTTRTVLVAGGVAVLTLGVLVAFDLSVGGGHLERNLSRSDGGGDLVELVTRRYELAFRAARVAGRPLLLAVAIAAVAAAIRNRRALYGRLPGQGWSAALVGGLAVGVVGMLVNDSGPVLFINAVLCLTAVTAYVSGEPA